MARGIKSWVGRRLVARSTMDKIIQDLNKNLIYDDAWRDLSTDHVVCFYSGRSGRQDFGVWFRALRDQWWKREIL